MAPEHAALEASLVPAEGDHTPEHSNGQLQQRGKGPGSSRRGKQYKCGNCGELGHNTKTCPRRASGGGEAQIIQPALGVDGTDVFTVAGLNNVGRAAGVPAVARVSPLKLDGALEAANRRVLSAENEVASAQSAEEFEDATRALDTAVVHLERVAACAKRCAVVAFNLSAPAAVEVTALPARETKRARIDTSQIAATPIAPRIEDVPPVSNEETTPAPIQENSTGGEQQQKIEEALE